MKTNKINSATAFINKLTPSKENLREIKILAVKITKIALAAITLASITALTIACFLQPSTIILGAMLIPVIYYQGYSALMNNMIALYTNHNIKDITTFYANIPHNTLKGFSYDFIIISKLFHAVGDIFYLTAKKIKIKNLGSPFEEKL